MTDGNSAERECFESAMEGEPFYWHRNLWTTENGEYRELIAQAAWFAWQARAALSVCADGGKGEAEGYAFRCDGKLWVVTDPVVAMRWQEQGFEVTPVTAPQIIGKGEAVFAWTTQEDIALMQKGLCGCYYPEREADINIPLYFAPQAECAPRAKERLWLMVADNFTRDEFEQAFVECAPRAECLIDKYSSRICENGTLSCDVEHPRADDGEIARDSCGLTMGQSRRLAAPIAPRADDGVSIIETPCHKEVGNHRIPKVAPRADLMQVANRVAAEFRDLASKLPDDVLAKLFSRADVDTAGAKPIAWLIDPGAGSAKDRLQSIEPSEFQLAEINRRGGSVTPLVAAGASNERADAEKDAERYRWLRADGFVPNDFEKVIDAAILAANKEQQL